MSTSFDGRDGELRLDGHVTTALVGADWSWGHSVMAEGEPSGSSVWRAGLLLAHSRGDGSYAEADSEEGKVKAPSSPGRAVP